ncbi:unnamed protein product, partial [Medioppia subpectinata]
HNINEELVRVSASACDSMADEKNKAIVDMLTVQKKCNQLQANSDKLMADLKVAKDNEEFFKSQNLNTNNKFNELEKHYRELYDKYAALERQQSSQNGKKELENELMSYKIQQKKCEMRISSLEKQFEQKCNENKQLSDMVDELIVKVRN